MESPLVICNTGGKRRSEGKREREKERENVCMCVCLCVCACACMSASLYIPKDYLLDYFSRKFYDNVVNCIFLR